MSSHRTKIKRELARLRSQRYRARMKQNANEVRRMRRNIHENHCESNNTVECVRDDTMIIDDGQMSIDSHDDYGDDQRNVNLNVQEEAEKEGETDEAEENGGSESQGREEEEEGEAGREDESQGEAEEEGEAETEDEDEGEEEGEEEREENDDDENRFNATEALRSWALNSNVPLTQLDDLLKILRQPELIPTLPKSAKTFLKTTKFIFEPRKLDGENGEGGELVYFGITKYLQKVVNVELHAEPLLELLFNIDGLPLYKSSSMQFWPILCMIHFEPNVYHPFPVAIYAGKKKPPNIHQFFEDLVAELNEILRNGVMIDAKLFRIQIKCIICDRPARALVKVIIGHGGYYACERCEDPGQHTKNRMIYPEINARPRTDASFRTQENHQHHRGVSPLLSIEPPINMVEQFSLDFMHLCCLGVMKKLILDFWLRRKVTTHLGRNGQQRLSAMLRLLASQIPEEFQRTTRDLDDIHRWKATEFRFILLYSGPIILKKILPDDLYQHFLLLHAACRILCSAEWALAYNNEANMFLRSFFLLASRLYGVHCQVLNMHSLIHLTDDVKNMNCTLTALTAFPFENALGKIKKMLRGGNRPLAQISRRLYERYHGNCQKASIPPEFAILKKNKHRDPEGIERIQKIQYKGFIISLKSPNNTVLLHDGTILQLNLIYKQHGSDEINLQGKVFGMKKSVYTYPVDSSFFSMWQVKETRNIKRSTLSSIHKKMIFMDIGVGTTRKLYCVPLLHGG